MAPAEGLLLLEFILAFGDGNLVIVWGEPEKDRNQIIPELTDKLLVEDTNVESSLWDILGDTIGNCNNAICASNCKLAVNNYFNIFFQLFDVVIKVWNC